MRLSVSHALIASSGIGSSFSDFLVLGPFPAFLDLKNILRFLREVLYTYVWIHTHTIKNCKYKKIFKGAWRSLGWKNFLGGGGGGCPKSISAPVPHNEVILPKKKHLNPSRGCYRVRDASKKPAGHMRRVQKACRPSASSSKKPAGHQRPRPCPR